MNDKKENNEQIKDIIYYQSYFFNNLSEIDLEENTQNINNNIDKIFQKAKIVYQYKHDISKYHKKDQSIII